MSDDIRTESDRIAFLQSIAEAIFRKARIRLDLQKIYAADGTAVAELLKLASLLYKATFNSNDDSEVRIIKHTLNCFSQRT